MVRLKVIKYEDLKARKLFQFQYGTIKSSLLRLYLSSHNVSIPVWYD